MRRLSPSAHHLNLQAGSGLRAWCCRASHVHLVCQLPGFQPGRRSHLDRRSHCLCWGVPGHAAAALLMRLRASLRRARLLCPCAHNPALLPGLCWAAHSSSASSAGQQHVHAHQHVQLARSSLADTRNHAGQPRECSSQGAGGKHSHRHRCCEGLRLSVFKHQRARSADTGV